MLCGRKHWLRNRRAYMARTKALDYAYRGRNMLRYLLTYRGANERKKHADKMRALFSFDNARRAYFRHNLQYNFKDERLGLQQNSA